MITSIKPHRNLSHIQKQVLLKKPYLKGSGKSCIDTRILNMIEKIICIKRCNNLERILSVNRFSYNVILRSFG